MEARGYGSGPRTRSPAAAATARERVLLALGSAMTVLVAVAVPSDGYRYYDLLGDPFTASGIATAAGIVALGAAAVAAIGWRRAR
jgi:hypothetical protein